MPASILLMAVTVLPPQQALERALDAVEPPPALRAAFRATLMSGDAVRRIEYDPYAPAGEQFKVTMKQGRDDELDAVVDGWRQERQADVRLFADDLRMSLTDAHPVQKGNQVAVEFRHKITPNDGPVDRLISPNMVGELTFDDATGYLTHMNYAIEKPVKLDDGTTLKEYRQTYDFGYSQRWGVSYVTGYELEASGGRWGVQESRHIRVTLTDIAFGLAGDAKQELASKSAPATSSTASIQSR